MNLPKDFEFLELSSYQLQGIEIPLEEIDVVKNQTVQIYDELCENLSPNSEFYQNYKNYLESQNFRLVCPQFFLWAIAIIDQKIITKDKTEEIDFYSENGEDIDILESIQFNFNSKNQLICSFDKFAFDLELESRENWEKIKTKVNYISKNLTLKNKVNLKIRQFVENNSRTAILLTQKPVNNYAYTIKIGNKSENSTNLKPSSKYNNILLDKIDLFDLSTNSAKHYQDLQKRQDLKTIQSFDICKAFEIFL